MEIIVRVLKDMLKMIITTQQLNANHRGGYSLRRFDAQRETHNIFGLAIARTDEKSQTWLNALHLQAKNE